MKRLIIVAASFGGILLFLLASATANTALFARHYPWLLGLNTVVALSLFALIGMIMLIGLVTKNGILIVEFANQNRLKGMKRTEAAIFSATQRFRPILMTSLAMSLGALPLALSLGAAATSRIPLGIVIVGGIMFSLVLTLFVIPAMYSFLSSAHKKNEVEQFIHPATQPVQPVVEQV